MNKAVLCLLLFMEGVKGLLKCPGPCTPPLHCRSLGGTILGYCVNHKACCDYERRVVGSCGGVIEDSQPVVYFQSPAYPKVAGGDLLCPFHVILSPSTLGIRIDLLDVQMESIPNNPVDYGGGVYPLCDSDMFFIKGFRGWSPDPRCGNLSGYSLLVEREEGQERLSFHMAMSSSAYKWNIRITQLSRAHYSHSYESLLNTFPPEEDLQVSNEDVPGEHKSYLSGYPRPIHPQVIFREEPDEQMKKQHNQIRFVDGDDDEVSDGGGVSGGRSGPSVRIGGGEDVKEGMEVPWQVSIQSVGESETEFCGKRENRSSHICGGSILDARTVLSAAHCFLSSARWAHPSTPVTNLKVIVGTSDLCSSTSKSTHLVSHVTLHVNYVSTELLNDVAVLHLKSPIPQWTDSVRPIPLAHSSPHPDSSKGVLLSGWGSKGLEENATYPSKLQVTSDLILMSPEECQEKQAKYLNFLQSSYPLSLKYSGAFNSVLCLLGGHKGVEAGYGDSGGPLVSDGSLIGIVSHMRPDADENGTVFHVDLFVNVYRFVKWIVLAAVPPLPVE